MAEFRPGAVVVVPFPYSDLSRSKLRPALVLATISHGDLVVCQITSKTYAERAAIKLNPSHFEQGGLPSASYIRPDKLATLHKDVCLGVAAYVNADLLTTTIDAACAVLRQGSLR